MRKKILTIILLFFVLILGMQYATTVPQKVYLSGKLIGFSIENRKLGQAENEVPTSSRQIGTVTFIKKDTNEFVALGHSTKTKNLDSKIGLCYDIKFGGIDKAEKDYTGSIVAILDEKKYLGYIYDDKDVGIFGKMNKEQENNTEVETSCWYNVKRGKANILMCLDGEELESYDVQIIGIDYLSKNKNIKVQITDQNLIEKTGGIIQGMSGTPLMQDRKINWSYKLCKC